MSNEWTAERIKEVRTYGGGLHDGRNDLEDAADEIERLQSRVAELESAAPKVGDVVVPFSISSNTLCDADFVAKCEALVAQHFPELAATLAAGQT